MQESRLSVIPRENTTPGKYLSSQLTPPRRQPPELKAQSYTYPLCSECRHADSFLLFQLYLGFIMTAIRLTVVHCFPLESQSDTHNTLLKDLFHNWNAVCWQLLLHIQFDCSAAQTCQLSCLLL